MKQNSFPKAEHLCGDKKTTRLFSEGQSAIVYPFRIVFLLLPEEDNIPVKVLISVSKKRFKRAVKRNHIKRLTRESYRLNKHELQETVKSRNQQLYIAFQYVANEILPFEVMEKKMKSALQKVKNTVEPI